MTPRHLQPLAPHQLSHGLTQPPRWTVSVDPPPKQHCNHSPNGIQQAAPAPSTASPPPAPNSPFTTPAMGLPTLPSGQPHLAAVQVPRAGLPPFCMPGLLTALLPVTSAIPMPRPPHGQAPAHHHCPTCTCGSNPQLPAMGLDLSRGSTRNSRTSGSK